MIWSASRRACRKTVRTPHHRTFLPINLRIIEFTSSRLNFAELNKPTAKNSKVKSQIEIYNDHHLTSPPTHIASTLSSRVDFWSDLKRGTRVNNIKLLAHARMMNRRTGNIYQIAESARLPKREFHSISQFGLIRAILSRYCRQKWASKCGSERTSAFFLFSWKISDAIYPQHHHEKHPRFSFR